jgi:UDP-N-acetylmuramoylalanine--D-glutamate ligase
VELKNKRVLVVGLGKSGLAAARFLRARGAWVTVSDARPATLIAELPQLVAEGIAVEAGSHGLLTFRRQDLIVVSPGVPMDVPELKTVRAMGVRVIGELELGAQFLRGQVLAITGSNGKTTTTTLVGEILKAAGMQIPPLRCGMTKMLRCGMKKMQCCGMTKAKHRFPSGMTNQKAMTAIRRR